MNKEQIYRLSKDKKWWDIKTTKFPLQCVNISKGPDIIHFWDKSIETKITLNINQLSNKYNPFYISNFLIQELLQFANEKEEEEEALQQKKSSSIALSSSYSSYSYTNNINRCPFKYVYGVFINGSVQKNLTIQSKYDGELVFLFKISKNRIKTEKACKKIMKRKDEIFLWIKKFFNIKRKHLDTIWGDRYKVIRNGAKYLQILFNNVFELNISIAFTYDRRIYHNFHYKGRDVHVYPLSKQELQIYAKELLQCKSQYQKDIKKMCNKGKSNECIEFLETNMRLSLGLLKVYFMREELVSHEIRQAILFFKAWKEILLFNSSFKTFLECSTIELLCVRSFQLLHRRKKSEITSLDIILEVFEILSNIHGYIANQGPGLMTWPYPKQSLISNEVIIRWMQKNKIKYDMMIFDNIVLRNVEVFSQWKELARSAESVKLMYMQRSVAVINEVVSNTNKICSSWRISDREVEMEKTEEMINKVIEHCFYCCSGKEMRSDQIVLKWAGISEGNKILEEINIDDNIVCRVLDSSRELRNKIRSRKRKNVVYYSWEDPSTLESKIEWIKMYKQRLQKKLDT